LMIKMCQEMLLVHVVPAKNIKDVVGD